ncbi:hypothetical protein GOBAR_AA20674 [Gossypium barbadense]|uniref:Uncharacterized protein n=1 Tax=Gossypium barbadense TaxID=3634 RepID=A0A2P5X9K7_GOSBA|nr:hypothetical protein GOBAR_AA20674 [Gossypium barbadense]
MRGSKGRKEFTERNVKRLCRGVANCVREGSENGIMVHKSRYARNFSYYCCFRALVLSTQGVFVVMRVRLRGEEKRGGGGVLFNHLAKRIRCMLAGFSVNACYIYCVRIPNGLL